MATSSPACWARRRRRSRSPTRPFARACSGSAPRPTCGGPPHLAAPGNGRPPHRQARPCGRWPVLIPIPWPATASSTNLARYLASSRSRPARCISGPIRECSSPVGSWTATASRSNRRRTRRPSSSSPFSRSGAVTGTISGGGSPWIGGRWNFGPCNSGTPAWDAGSWRTAPGEISRSENWNPGPGSLTAGSCGPQFPSWGGATRRSSGSPKAAAG